MQKPLKKILFLGVGLVAVILIGGVLFDNEAANPGDRLTDPESGEAVYAEPSVGSSYVSTQDSMFFYFVSVSNREDYDIYFYAEVLLVSKTGEILENCSSEQKYTLRPGEELTFKTICRTDGQGYTELKQKIRDVRYQFFDSR